MSENAKHYSIVCSKIGFAMLLFYAFFTLSTFGVAFFSEYLAFFIGKYAANITYEILAAIVYFLSFSAAAFILRNITKDLPTSRPIYTSFKVSRYFVLFIVAVIAVNFTIAFLNGNLVISLFPGVDYDTLTQNATTIDSFIDSMEEPDNNIELFIIGIFSTAVVPAICEEYLFRGAVLTNLLPFGKTTAILGSAFLFGLMHQNPMQWLYTTLMGVVIGYVYVKTKSIWACMIIHFVNNLITVLEEYLAYFTNISWLEVLLDLIVVITGGIAFIILLRKKDKEPSIDEIGSFGVVYERGMDVEEYALELSHKEKVKKFFTPTMIIYTVICVFLMLKSLSAFIP